MLLTRSLLTLAVLSVARADEAAERGLFGGGLIGMMGGGGIGLKSKNTSEPFPSFPSANTTLSLVGEDRTASTTSLHSTTSIELRATFSELKHGLFNLEIVDLSEFIPDDPANYLCSFLDTETTKDKEKIARASCTWFDPNETGGGGRRRLLGGKDIFLVAYVEIVFSVNAANEVDGVRLTVATLVDKEQGPAKILYAEGGNVPFGSSLFESASIGASSRVGAACRGCSFPLFSNSTLSFALSGARRSSTTPDTVLTTKIAAANAVLNQRVSACFNLALFGELYVCAFLEPTIKGKATANCASSRDVDNHPGYVRLVLSVDDKECVVDGLPGVNVVTIGAVDDATPEVSIDGLSDGSTGARSKCAAFNDGFPALGGRGRYSTDNLTLSASGQLRNNRDVTAANKRRTRPALSFLDNSDHGLFDIQWKLETLDGQAGGSPPRTYTCAYLEPLGKLSARATCVRYPSGGDGDIAQGIVDIVFDIGPAPGCSVDGLSLTQAVVYNQGDSYSRGILFLEQSNGGRSLGGLYGFGRR